MVTIPVLQRHPDDSWTLADPKKVSRRTHRVMLALADAIMPPAPRTETTLDDVIRHALVALQYMPRSSVVVLLAGMRFLNWAPLWRLRGLRPLTRLSRDQARRHLGAVMRSRWLPVRFLMYGPLGLFMSTYFDQDYVHRVIGYDPVPFVEERIELRRRWIEGDEPGRDQEIHHLPGMPS
jgi:hypothetical protein